MSDETHSHNGDATHDDEGAPHDHPRVSGHAFLDPRPVNYRESRLCTVLVSNDVKADLGVSHGEVVRISTSRGRAVLCRVEETLEELPAESVRVDRHIRQALKAYPHDQLTVEPVTPEPTSEVALLPGIDLTFRYDPDLVPMLKKALVRDQVALRSGMSFYIQAPDRLSGIVYDVHFVSGGEGVVTPETTIWLVSADHDHGPDDHEHSHEDSSVAVIDTTFEDIGGLAEQIHEVREFIELPLIFPQVYRQLGINTPRGVIFQGAPGTGKTLLARAVANEINAQFFYVNGPEVVGTYSGETEANLRRVFAEALLNTPSIILIDELDALAPIRRTAANFSDVRLVGQLLSLLDGLTRAEGVLVIGTTNRVEAIDPALRRAGRFDREIDFPTPSADAREEILRVQTREMPLDDEAVRNLRSVAERAYGFVGADLMELTREAGLAALRHAAQPFITSPSLSSFPDAKDLVVRAEDLESALSRIRPASMRESLIAFPTTTWSDIGGLENIKKRLRDLVEKPLKHPDWLERVGFSSNLGILLYGPPGAGKTLLVKALAHEAGVNFIPIQGPEIFSMWLGESEESVRHIFNVARRSAPCIVFFDQLDAIVPNRSDLEHEGTRAPQRVVNQLLAELDGIAQRTGVVVIGATNRISMVDKAALRPGRFGVHLQVGLPDEADRSAILRIHLSNATFAPGLNLNQLIDYLVPLTNELSGAELAFLCQSAKLAAIEAVGSDAKPVLSIRNFDEALREVFRLPED